MAIKLSLVPATTTYQVEALPARARLTLWAALALVLVLAVLPLLASNQVVEKLTVLFIYVLLAAMWNLLAGYAGLASVGQQAFFGLSAYFALRLVEWGAAPYPAMLLGALGVAPVALLASYFLLRLKGGEFAIASWVVAEAVRIVVMFDVMVQGETGTSLLALNAYDAVLRRKLNYEFGLLALALMLGLSYWLLRGRVGANAQAIRDDEEAAHSIGIAVMRTKRIIFVLGAVGAGLAGVVWLASAITFLPRTNFGIQWSVFMLFMVLVGGLGTFEGAILGAIVLFVLQELFSDFGVWYLLGLGALAVAFALLLPGGLWERIRKHTGIELFPTQRVLRVLRKPPA
jgi:branched-chain amino acid transport system permease protein